MALVVASQPFTSEFSKSMDTNQTKSGNGEEFGDSLKNFLDLAMKMAQIDEAVESARANAPSEQDSEAQKWHEVSIKALLWTRSSFAEQQSNALGQLKGLAMLQRLLPSTSTPCSQVAPPGPRSSKLLTPSQAGARVATGEVSVGSLRDDLERLKQYDTQQCLIVRRIKRLGLGSPAMIREHFSGYGEVAEVLISHSFEKKSQKCRADRVRPAALGFVVMATVEGAHAALHAGPTIMIDKVDVNVQIFEHSDTLKLREGEPKGNSQ